MADDALFQLGMGLDAPNTALTEDFEPLTPSIEPGLEPDDATDEAAADFFIEKNGVRCAGAHLLHVHLHPFEPNGGISGVAVLAESHISVHSWPERDYAAFDVFMCGRARPERCIEVLKEAFDAERLAVKEILRGREA